jgi:hypothetical protein
VVLRTSLLCDDLRFLPSAEPLRLAFALLLKYPHVDDETLAGVLLLGQLNRITGHTRPNQIERSVVESNRLGEALAAFPSATDMLGDTRAFQQRLQRVESMNDPWVSLMYWYQRANDSKDYLASNKGTYLSLDKTAAATKEHIVPFSLLYRNYDVDPRGHSASHVVNAIGNLTMVSSDMNYGHGSDPVDLKGVDPELLRAHHLDDPEVLQRYAAVIRVIQTAGSKDLIRSRYERFVRARTQRLASGMYTWLLTTTELEPSDSVMRPQSRRMSPSSADLLLKDKTIPKPFKDALLDMRVRSDGTFWLLHRTSAKYTRADKIRVEQSCDALHVGLGIPGIDALTARLSTLLKQRFADEREIIYVLRPRTAAAREAIKMVAEFTGSSQ